MHTVKIVALGFLLLAVIVGIGRATGGAPRAATAALTFLPLWLVGAGINMWIGVSRAGYSVSQEAPIFVVVFAVPALVALGLWWRLRGAA